MVVIYCLVTELVPYMITLDMGFFNNFAIDDIKTLNNNLLIDID